MRQASQFLEAFLFLSSLFFYVIRLLLLSFVKCSHYKLPKLIQQEKWYFCWNVILCPLFWLQSYHTQCFPQLRSPRSNFDAGYPYGLMRTCICQCVSWGTLNLQTHLGAHKITPRNKIIHLQLEAPTEHSLTFQQVYHYQISSSPEAKDVHFTFLWTFGGWINYEIYGLDQIITEFRRTLKHAKFIKTIGTTAC